MSSKIHGCRVRSSTVCGTGEGVGRYPAVTSAWYSGLTSMWDRIDVSPEYQALVTAGYRPTPSPVPHTVDDLTRHPWILLDIAHHGVVLHDPESILERELAAVRRRMAELGSRRIELPDGSWYWD